MKTASVTIYEKTRNFGADQFKSDKIQEQSEKILSLFDDDSYSEEDSLLTRINSSCPVTVPNKIFCFILILTLLLNFCQLTKLNL